MQDVMSGQWESSSIFSSAEHHLFMVITILRSWKVLRKDILNSTVKPILISLVPIWNSISPECKDLVSKMLVPADKRITAQQVLDHPWIKKFADKKEAAVVTPILTKNLKTFKGAQKVKKAVLTYLATQLSEKEIEPMKKLFLSIDANGDGRLSREEIQAGFKGRSDEKELLEIMAAMDTDGSGFIDYNGKKHIGNILEFIAAAIGEEIYLNKDKLQQAFNMLIKYGRVNIL